MKILVPVEKMAVRILPGLVAGCCMLAAMGFSNVNPNSLPETSLFRDTMLVQKLQTSKKHRIKLYPNASHQVLFFSASGQSGKVYQLYLFSIEGKLVKQANIRHKQTTVLNNIEKGSYLFEVFSDDERIENGQLLIK